MLDAILGVFSDLGTWITEMLANLEPLFYNSTDSSLTFLGVLAVAGLGISVVFLLIGVIQRFLHFRG